ncbi:MAG: type II toxin-antitoxin system Phd/YefM family antitoxin [Candidatus Dormibacteraceae bacterium]
MARAVTATEAKATILRLLDEVEAGGDIEITRRGRVVARLVPARGPHALRDRFRGIAKDGTENEEDLFSTGVEWEFD